jgi:predicted RNase H-like nuclease (RuvC/YqgF family)
MNQGEGEPKDYKEYFYGNESKNLDPVNGSVSNLVIPENSEDIKLKLEELKSQIELAKENKDKHDSLNKNSEYKIEEDALTSEIKEADKIFLSLKEQEEILKNKLSEMSHKKQSFRSKIASFLGLLP